MPDLVKKTIRRARSHPIIAALMLTAVALVGLANAGRAIEQLGTLWASWTHKSPRLETTWQGTWESRRGYKFAFVMQLEVLANDSADGRIRWRLIETPPASTLADRINDEATEFVSGGYDRQKRVATLVGRAVSDATLIVPDTYKFQVLADNVSFLGMTKDNDGSWAAAANGRVIVVEKR